MQLTHMKSFIFYTTVLGLATTTLWAQTDSSTSPSSPNAIETVPASSSAPVESVSPPPPSAEAPVKAKHQPPNALDQKGKIEKIDVTAGTLVVGGKSFVLSKKGKVFVDGVKMSFSDLKEGDVVAVVYFAKSDGTNTATRVIKGHKGKKKAKTTESKE